MILRAVSIHVALHLHAITQNRCKLTADKIRYPGKKQEGEKIIFLPDNITAALKNT